MPNMTGPELKKLREKKKLTRKALADLIAASWRTIEGWEQGKDPIPAAKEKFILLVLSRR